MHYLQSPMDARRHGTPTHKRLYPNSHGQFGNMTVHGEACRRRRMACMNSPEIVDIISCRQMYLRSYTFTREEEEEEETFQSKTMKCLGRLRKSEAYRKLLGLSKAREMSHNILFSIYSRMLSCTTKIGVATM
ncbi:hypothetical protein SAY86_026824 [Trapa natans]|uniref:Uncharacterized protein n=1 Tax=Trapa natans TaxID=22666 RepID=A0AAN7KIH4_TRANT|nr:hypothetical protein SAY86_026824 [Trapa natans]